MSTKLIAYDLNSPHQDYSALIDAIKALGPWWNHLDSTWLVKSPMSTAQIRDRLATVLDPDDELLVIEVTGRARAWRGFSSRANRWIQDIWD